MKIFEYTEDINVDTAHISDELSDILYFDIETTGFSAARTSLYLIGCTKYWCHTTAIPLTSPTC